MSEEELSKDVFILMQEWKEGALGAQLGVKPDELHEYYPTGIAEGDNETYIFCVEDTDHLQ